MIPLAGMRRTVRIASGSAQKIFAINSLSRSADTTPESFGGKRDCLLRQYPYLRQESRTRRSTWHSIISGTEAPRSVPEPLRSDGPAVASTTISSRTKVCTAMINVAEEVQRLASRGRLGGAAALRQIRQRVR
jgi:hypothetical protein